MPTRQIEIHEQAAAEYDTAFDWYLQRNPNAARDFDAEVAKALSRIREAPKRWAIGSYGSRRYLLKRFPFVVVYQEQADSCIQIIAFAHTSRKPGYWKKRTEE